MIWSCSWGEVYTTLPKPSPGQGRHGLHRVLRGAAGGDEVRGPHKDAGGRWRQSRESSFPAMGWPATNRYRPVPRCCSIPAQISPLMPQVSVRMAPSFNWGPQVLANSKAVSG